MDAFMFEMLENLLLRMTQMQPSVKYEFSLSRREAVSDQKGESPIGGGVLFPKIPTLWWAFFISHFRI